LKIKQKYLHSESWTRVATFLYPSEQLGEHRLAMDQHLVEVVKELGHQLLGQGRDYDHRMSDIG
jgi:hypothetical protein